MDVVYELLLRLGLKLTVKITEYNGVYWLYDEQKHDEQKRYAIILKPINDNTLINIINNKPNKVVALDKVFISDSQKSNMLLQLKDANIDIETI